MFRRSLTLLAIALVGAILTATPAQAATYSVSIYMSAPKADVGKYVTISGGVGGSKAAYKTLRVQRRIGTAAWTTIASTRTSSTRKYSYKHKVSAVGAQSFRVVAPGSGSTKTGISTTKAFTGWKWLWLSEQNLNVNGDANLNTSHTILGSSSTHDLEISPGTTAYWNIYGQCDSADIDLYSFDRDGGGTLAEISNDDGLDQFTLTSSAFVPVDPVRSFTEWLRITNLDNGYNTVNIVDPQVHCSVAKLS